MGIPEVRQLLVCQRALDGTAHTNAANHGRQAGELGTLELLTWRVDRSGFCRTGSLG